MSEFVTVAKVGDIRAGEGAAFEVSGRMVAVFLQDGEYLAIDDMCPHAGASLACGFVEGHEVTCPWHAWRFDIRDGTWCDNRRLKVDTFEVRVVGNEIQVRPHPSGQSGDLHDTPQNDETDSRATDVCATDERATDERETDERETDERAANDRAANDRADLKTAENPPDTERADKNRAREDSEHDDAAPDTSRH